MKEKDIKRIIKKQLKSKHPNWRLNKGVERIHNFQEKQIIKQTTSLELCYFTRKTFYRFHTKLPRVIRIFLPPFKNHFTQKKSNFC